MGCSDSKAAQSGAGVRVDTGSSSAPHRTKLVVCGDRAAGKSCLVQRYVKGAFPDNAVSTIGAAFSTKDVTLPDKSIVRWQIWDTAGEEVYRAMTKSFFRDALVGIILYDVTNPSSFSHVPSWLEEFREQCPDSLAVLVANKMDRVDALRVPSAEARAFAARHNLLFYEVSAKSGHGVEELFMGVAEKLNESRINRTGPFA